MEGKREGQKTGLHGVWGALRHKMSRRGIAVCFLALFLSGLAGAFLREGETGESSESAPPPRILPVRAATVHKSDRFRVSRTYTGQVEARRSTELGFELAGRIRSVSVEEGETVETGTVLAALDTRKLRNRRRELSARLDQERAKLDEMIAGPRKETIGAARAKVEELRQELALAKLEYKRRARLQDRKAISREDYDRAAFKVGTLGARLDAAESELEELLSGTREERMEAQRAVVEQLKAQVESVGIDLDKSVLEAPYAGTVAVRHRDEGAVVSAGQPVLRLVETGRLELRVGVPPQAAKELEPGQRRIVEVGGDELEAVVKAVLPELDASTRTTEVVLRLERQPGGHVRPGQMARLEVEEHVATPGFWLPTSALAKGARGLWDCYALVEPGETRHPAKDAPSVPGAVFQVESRSVEVLHTEGDRVFVRGTLREGEKVVREGIHRIAPGQWARLAAN